MYGCVVTHLRSGARIFNDSISTNFLFIPTVKKVCKLVNNWWSYKSYKNVPIFGPPCTCRPAVLASYDLAHKRRKPSHCFEIWKSLKTRDRSVGSSCNYTVECLEYNNRVVQKVSNYQMIKNRIKSYWSLSMRLDLFVKLKYESSSIIRFVGIRYSMRDLLSDLNNYAWPENLRYASDTVNDVSASSGISSP